ncbi:MAG TPA: nucleotidyltransferase domain-containing protein [Burkholderiales bacterium]
MTDPLYKELSLSAQTAYGELLEQARAFDLEALAGLKGAFHKRSIHGHSYVYFGYRDLDGRMRMAYVGPDDERVDALVSRYRQVKAPRKLAPAAQAAQALGCAATPPRHFRIIRQLAAYGFFRAGGVLVGTHAFVAMANMLGVRWTAGERTQDVDFAHAGRNLSIALPADVRISVHDALSSLEMGLLPAGQLSGKAGAQYRNPADPELRLDFLTSETRSGKTVILEELGLALEPLKFMEYPLTGTTQAALLAREGACVVNLPAPERYAVHKLIVYGERSRAERVKAAKDIEQAAALAQWHLANGEAARFNRAWRDAVARGRGWKSRAEEGRRVLLVRHPDLSARELWRSR